MSITFLVDSDLHFKHEIISTKTNNVNKIITLAQKEKINALICPGDLTDNGWDGAHFTCWKYGGDYDQLTPYKEQYEKPISKHIPIYECAGNHDYYVPPPHIHHGVLDYIKSKHGGLRYSFDIDKLHFIALDRYPDKDGMNFLKDDIKKHKDKDIIIFFHYNLTGPYSEWWSEDEKEKFYEVIKYYKVKALLVGHLHSSMLSEWKGYKVILAGGPKIAKCIYDGENVNVEFI